LVMFRRSKETHPTRSCGPDGLLIDCYICRLAIPSGPSDAERFALYETGLHGDVELGMREVKSLGPDLRC
jgi:hypothetical protein